MPLKAYSNALKTEGCSKEVVIITDAYYREALDMQRKAKNKFIEKENQLKKLNL